jgi:hypothetical protein
MATTMTPEQLLAEVRAGKLDLAKLPVDQLLVFIKAQEAEAAENVRKAAEQATYGIKIGRSGTVSVSGFGRYGISLYDSQWDQLIPLIPAIQRFRKAYAAQIKAQAGKVAAMSQDERKAYENSPNEFKPLKLRADSEFKEPVAA